MSTALKQAEMQTETTIIVHGYKKTITFFFISRNQKKCGILSLDNTYPSEKKRILMLYNKWHLTSKL